MYINFSELSIGEAYGVDSTLGLAKVLGIDLPDNEWLTYKEAEDSLGHTDGADVRCHLVHLGKVLTTNPRRLRLAVYDCDSAMETVALFPLSQKEAAIAMMYSYAGYGEITCCE